MKLTNKLGYLTGQLISFCCFKQLYVYHKIRNIYNQIVGGIKYFHEFRIDAQNNYRIGLTAGLDELNKLDGENCDALFNCTGITICCVLITGIGAFFRFILPFIVKFIDSYIGNH